MLKYRHLKSENVNYQNRKIANFDAKIKYYIAITNKKREIISDLPFIANIFV